LQKTEQETIMSESTDDAEEVEDSADEPKVKGKVGTRVIECHHPGCGCLDCEHASYCVAPTKGKAWVPPAPTPAERWAKAKGGKK